MSIIEKREDLEIRRDIRKNTAKKIFWELASYMSFERGSEITEIIRLDMDEFYRLRDYWVGNLDDNSN